MKSARWAEQGGTCRVEQSRGVPAEGGRAGGTCRGEQSRRVPAEGDRAGGYLQRRAEQEGTCRERQSRGVPAEVGRAGGYLQKCMESKSCSSAASRCITICSSFCPGATKVTFVGLYSLISSCLP